MAYEVIILGHLHMPLYFLETFTEYPELYSIKSCNTLIISVLYYLPTQNVYFPMQHVDIIDNQKLIF